jgi:hypothetical protein
MKGSASLPKRVSVGGSSNFVQKVLPLTSDLGELKKQRFFNATPMGLGSLNPLRPATVQDHLNKRKIVMSVDKTITY